MEIVEYQDGVNCDRRINIAIRVSGQCRIIFLIIAFLNIYEMKFLHCMICIGQQQQCGA